MNEIERERRALRLFEQMLALDPPERDQWLAGHADGDPTLTARVSSLARLHGAGALRTGGAMDSAEPVLPPTRIGAYRITGLIGAGGMGAVYAATRDRGDFAHDVAIKLIKPGLLSQRLAQRFAHERQVLARLSHPNIARLFDGGETADGQPFIVMERVIGQTLPEWLAREDPSRGRRIAVYLQVCDAVEYLHRHLVIHRDLTASNVLIDRDGNARLIDLGIARLGGDDPVSAPVPGEADLHRLTITPGYVSPERLRGAIATTLDDVYAAGRLLAVIIGSPCPRELKAIADKATAPDPADRYRSIEDLAEDVRRYRSGYPVAALPGGWFHALAKWAGRNRSLSASLALLIVAVIAGSGTTAWKWREAERARSDAMARLADTRTLANVMMFDAFDELGAGGASTRAKLLMARNAQTYLDALASDPDASFDARFAAAEGFQRLGLVTGGPDNANVGELLAGLGHLEQSHRILLGLVRERPERRTRLALTESHLALMQMKGRSYLDTAKAIEHGREARALLDQMQLVSPGDVALAARVDRHLGDMLGCCSTDPASGGLVIEEGLRLIDRSPSAVRADPAVRRARNDLVNLSAGFRMLAGTDADGLSTFRAALASQRALLEKTGHPDDRELEAVIATNLSRTLLRMGRIDEADRVISPSHARALDDYLVDPANNRIRRRLAVMTLARSWVAAARGDRAQARRYLADGLGFARAAEWPSGFADVPSLNFAHRLQEASETYWALRDAPAACEIARQSAAMYNAYSRKLDLPATTLRYRIARMLRREGECRGTPAATSG